MRVRSRVLRNHPGSLETISWAGYAYGTAVGGGGYGPTGPFLRSYHVEDISDQEIVVPVNYHAINEVTHVVQKFDVLHNGAIDCRYGDTRFTATAPNGLWFYAYWWIIQDRMGNGATRLTANQITAGFSMDRSAMVNAVLKKFYFEENEASGFESLIESHALWPSFRRTIAGIRNLNHWGDRRKFLKLGKVVSGAFLFYSFAIAPLLRDMEATRRHMVEFNRLLNAYLNRMNKPRRYSVVNRGRLSYDRGAPYNPSVQPDAKWVPQYTGELAERRVVLQGITSLPYDGSFFKKMQFITDTLGATGPASLAWEFVPFSFVVDWFVDTQVWLGALDNLLQGRKKTVLGCSESTKIMTSETSSWQKGSSISGSDMALDGQPYSMSSVSSYHREPILAQPSFGWSGRFGKKQLALSLALFYQLGSELKVMKQYF